MNHTDGGGGLDFPEYTDDALKIKIPSGVMVAGPTQSGKSTFIKRIVEWADEMFSPPPKHIIYAYGAFDKRVFSDFQTQGCEIMDHLPTDEEMDQAEKPLLLIIDDFMEEVKGKYLQDLFTKKAHHKNMCVMYVTQYLYDKGAKIARYNSQYLLLMKAKNAALQVNTLGRQIFADEFAFFKDAYNKATGVPYGYLLINLHPTADDNLRLRTNIFPDEIQTVFLPKKN